MWWLRTARHTIRHQAFGALWRHRDPAAGHLEAGRFLLRGARFGGRGAHAIEYPDIVDRVFESRNGRARSEHPAAEYRFRWFVELALHNIEVSRALRRLLRRALVARPHRDLQGTEYARLTDRRLDG